jgi:hypothetical protein
MGMATNTITFQEFVERRLRNDLLAGRIASEGDCRSLLTVVHGMAIRTQSLERSLTKSGQRQHYNQNA